MMEDKPTFFFFHFQCTSSEISDARGGALLLNLRQQRTTKATGNAWCRHLQTLSLALALVQRLRCEHLFFLQLMGTNPRSSPFAADTRLSYWDLNQGTDQHNNPFTPDTRESSSAILKPIKNLKGLESRTRWEIKRARDGSKKEETFIGMFDLWLLLIRRCSPNLSFQSNQIKANDFATGVVNEKRCLRSSQWLLGSLRMGWQVVSTTIFDDSWIFNQTGNGDGDELLRRCDR
jgi:hypothetical protein